MIEGMLYHSVASNLTVKRAFFIAFLVSLIFFGCSVNPNSKPTKKNEIFLGYFYPMTSAEYNEHTNDLHKKGVFEKMKMEGDYEEGLYYQLHFENADSTSLKLSPIFEGEFLGGISLTTFDKLDHVLEFYEKKYGRGEVDTIANRPEYPGQDYTKITHRWSILNKTITLEERFKSNEPYFVGESMNSIQVNYFSSAYLNFLKKSQDSLESKLIKGAQKDFDTL